MMDLETYRVVLEWKLQRKLSLIKQFGYDEAELALRQDMAAMKTVWYNSFLKDWWCFMRNTHPVMATCLSHRLHMVSKSKRFFIYFMLISLHMTFSVLSAECATCLESFECDVSGNNVKRWCCTVDALGLLSLYAAAGIWGLAAIFALSTIILGQIWFVIAACGCCQHKSPKVRNRWELLATSSLAFFGIFALLVLIYDCYYIAAFNLLRKTAESFVIMKSVSFTGAFILQSLIFFSLWRQQTSEPFKFVDKFHLTYDDLLDMQQATHGQPKVHFKAANSVFYTPQAIEKLTKSGGQFDRMAARLGRNKQPHMPRISSTAQFWSSPSQSPQNNAPRELSTVHIVMDYGGRARRSCDQDSAPAVELAYAKPPPRKPMAGRTQGGAYDLAQVVGPVGGCPYVPPPRPPVPSLHRLSDRAAETRASLNRTREHLEETQSELSAEQGKRNRLASQLAERPPAPPPLPPIPRQSPARPSGGGRRQLPSLLIPDSSNRKSFSSTDEQYPGSGGLELSQQPRHAVGEGRGADARPTGDSLPSTPPKWPLGSASFKPEPIEYAHDYGRGPSQDTQLEVAGASRPGSAPMVPPKTPLLSEGELIPGAQSQSWSSRRTSKSKSSSECFAEDAP